MERHLWAGERAVQGKGQACGGVGPAEVSSTDPNSRVGLESLTSLYP